MKNLIHIDFETRSEADLKAVGAVEYAKHKSTEVICMAYAINDGRVDLWINDGKNKFPKIVLEALNKNRFKVVAHNAGFEHAILKHTLKIFTPSFSRFKCTAAKAAALGLPRSLEGVSNALKLPVKKNMDGRKLMLKHCKPRTSWNHAPIIWGTKGDDWEQKYFEDEEEREKIYSYCMLDVVVERMIDEKLPDLIPSEQEVWEINMESNTRGVYVDVPLASNILELIDSHSIYMNRKSEEICGFRPTQRDKILKWCQYKGANLHSLAKGAVEDFIEAHPHVDPDVKTLLALRLASAKSSTKKFKALVDRAGKDSRVRDFSMYHGATTGREAGKGLQLQNLAKPTVKHYEDAFEDLENFEIEKQSPSEMLEYIETIYAEPMSLFSSSIRGMIKATPGYELYMADYAAIEARVVNWLAKEETILKAYRNGEDLYLKMASEVYGRPITQKGPEREFGKKVELGCGFGLGDRGLLNQLIAEKVQNASRELAQRGVRSYRRLHRNVVNLWYALERAAILATQRPGTIVKLNYVEWKREGNFLFCRLPSGRRLSYPYPFIRNEPDWNGVLKPRLYHMGVHSKTMQWTELALWHGTLIENIVQAIARDIAMEAIKRLRRNGFKYLFMVHDELISEAPIGHATVKEYEDLLTAPVDWAPGLPIAAEGEIGPRYKK